MKGNSSSGKNKLASRKGKMMPKAKGGPPMAMPGKMAAEMPMPGKMKKEK